MAEGSPRLRFLDLLDLFASSKLDLLTTLVDMFHAVHEELFGDTVRYRVLSVFLKHRRSVTLSFIARELNLSKSTIAIYSRNGRLYSGSIRKAIGDLANKGIIVEAGNPNQSRYSLNEDHIIVQYLIATRHHSISRAGAEGAIPHS